MTFLARNEGTGPEGFSDDPGSNGWIGGGMLAGLVLVGLAVGVVFLHYLVFQLLDYIIGLRFTLGVFALAYVLFWLFVHEEKVRFYLFPRSWGRPKRYRARRAPDVVPDEPVESVLMSLKEVGRATTSTPADRVLKETTELLTAVRVGMHELLSEYVGREKPCRIIDEHYGMVSTHVFDSKGYYYLHKYVEVTSGYPPVKRRRTETLAYIWRFKTDHGPAEVTLTIDAERKGQLLLKAERRWFPADPAGWRELIERLSPE